MISKANFMLHQHRQSGEWFTVPPEVAIAAVMGAAYRMGHAIRPVDPDRVEAFTPKIREEMPKWAQWAAFCIYLIVFFAVLFKTDHFLTALIVAPLAVLIIAPLMRKVVAITALD
jgi:hypothetical protein